MPNPLISPLRLMLSVFFSLQAKSAINRKYNRQTFFILKYFSAKVRLLQIIKKKCPTFLNVGHPIVFLIGTN